MGWLPGPNPDKGLPWFGLCFGGEGLALKYLCTKNLRCLHYPALEPYGNQSMALPSVGITINVASMNVGTRYSRHKKALKYVW